jgi:hypothetical protein
VGTTAEIPSSSEGDIGCLFDEISNLVEPIERPVMDGWAGLTSHGRRNVPERLDRTKNIRPTEKTCGEYWLELRSRWAG